MRLSATLNTGKPHGESSYDSGSESARSRIVLAARRRVIAMDENDKRGGVMGKRFAT